MFAKGKIRGNGVQLARYLMTGEEGERVELVDTRGLEACGPDPTAAFAALQDIADANTRSTKPFFHGHIRLPADERLTDAQWMQTLDLMEKRLGFEGQPRIVTFHHLDENGDKHLHVGWFRIDLETMRAIDPGLYKNDLRELCREQERAFGLRQLDNERQAHDRAPAAAQAETEESRRLGTDVREIRTAILDCYEHSDSGRAFNVALEERGLILANGDRRDCFVVIDQEGGQHALNKKLTGMTLATIRERFADLDRSQLPNVGQAQEMQRNRQAEHTAQPEAANQNDRDPMTLEAIRLDPWQAVYLNVPVDADRTLLAAVATCADQCAKFAFAASRVDAVIMPDMAQYSLDRQADALTRRDEARARLAALPPEQMAKVSPFLHPERLQDDAMASLRTTIGQRHEQMEFRGYATAEMIDQNAWNAHVLPLPPDANSDLLYRIFETSISLGVEAVQRGEDAYTPQEAQLWNVVIGDLNALRHEVFIAAQHAEQLEGKAEAWMAKGRYDELRPAHRETVAMPNAAGAQQEPGTPLPPVLEATDPGIAEVTQEFRGAAGQVTEPEMANQTVTKVERELEGAPLETVEAAREGLGVLARIGQAFLGLFGGWATAPPKLTPEQAKLKDRAEAEAAPERAAAAQAAAEWKTQDDGFEARRRAARQLEEAQLGRILGHTTPAEAQRDVDFERTRQRERERDQY
jgi:hypothetical protein